MAFPSTSVLDSFNRSNEGPPPSSSWGSPAVDGKTGLRVVSNTVGPPSGASQSNAYWNTAFGADQEAYATISTMPGNDNWIAFILRLSNPDSGSEAFYVISFEQRSGTDVVGVYLIDGDVTPLGAEISQALAVGDGIGASIIGSTITVYHKPAAGSWGSIGTRSDSTLSGGGYIGLEISGATGRADDFGGGTVVSVVSQSTSGALSWAGVQTRKTGISPAGVLSFSGSVLKAISKTLTGSASPSGAQVRKTGLSPSGVLSSAGAMVRSVSAILGGALSPDGGLLKAVSTIVSGALSSSGGLSAITIVQVVIAGALGFAGSISRKTGLSFAGALSPAGELLKAVSTFVSGALSSSGSLSARTVVQLVISGAISFTGAISRKTGLSFAGALSPAGGLLKAVSTFVSGVLSSAGVLLTGTVVQMAIAGALSFTGAISRKTGLSFAGALSPAGAIQKKTYRLIAGVLSLAGSSIGSTFTAVVRLTLRARSFAWSLKARTFALSVKDRGD